VGGENASLLTFSTDQVTVYQVRPRHRHQEVQEIVPANYQAVMVTDRGRSYEAHSFSRVKQQKKCLAHLQKTLSVLLEKKKGRARELGENLKMLFGMALDLWEEYHAGAVTDFDARAAELRFAVSYQLRERTLRDRDNQHLLKALRQYHLKGELLRFLEEPLVEPTNNRVERALRPAVIARKVSQCSKNDEGAYAFSAFKSVVQTLVKRGADSVVEALYTLPVPRSPIHPWLSPQGPGTLITYSKHRRLPEKLPLHQGAVCVAQISSRTLISSQISVCPFSC
jgi:transposase